MSKIVWREELKIRRASLSYQRRQEAAVQLLSALTSVLEPFKTILSFSSFGTEIDTSQLNSFLAQSGKLLLPYCCGETLKIFSVRDPSRGEILPHEIEIILVPGLGFDDTHHRIGYGKGYYDRFLPLASQALSIGIGFKEQYVPLLPHDPTDVPLKKVSLF